MAVGRTAPISRRIPDAARDIRSALEGLARHELLDRSVEVRTRLKDAEQAAHARCVLPFHDEDCAAALEEVRRLAGERELEEAGAAPAPGGDRRIRRPSGAVAGDRAAARGGGAAVARRLRSSTSAPSANACPVTNSRNGGTGTTRARELLADVRALLDEDAAREVLQSRPDILERLREALASLGEWLQPDIGPAPGAPGEERPGVEGPWPEPDDWPIVCKRNIVEA